MTCNSGFATDGPSDRALAGPDSDESSRDGGTEAARTRANSTSITVAANCRELDAEHLFERHYNRVVRFFLKSLPADLAHELAQQTIVEAYCSRAKFNPTRGSERSWINGIAAHLGRQHYRTAMREIAAYGRAASRNRGEERGEELFDERAADRIDAQILQGDLARALDVLTEREYEVLTTYCWYELTYPELARILRTSEGNVKATIYNARDKVRKSLSASDANRPLRQRWISGKEEW